MPSVSWHQVVITPFSSPASLEKEIHKSFHCYESLKFRELIKKLKVPIYIFIQTDRPSFNGKSDYEKRLLLTKEILDF